MLLIIQNNITYEKAEFDFKGISKPKCHIGAWGQRRASFLRQFEPERYNEMLCNETIGDYLERIDKEACEMYDNLMKEYAKQQNITEELKAENRLLWVQKMNSANNKAKNIVYDKLIFKD